jgi:hypothetical protein
MDFLRLFIGIFYKFNTITDYRKETAWETGIDSRIQCSVSYSGTWLIIVLRFTSGFAIWLWALL